MRTVEQHRHQARKRRYGLTYEQYLVLVEQHGGKCAICGRQEDIRLCVDHDHETQKVRGLLCHRCNMAIGALGDSIEGLQRALRYLEKFK